MTDKHVEQGPTPDDVREQLREAGLLVELVPPPRVLAAAPPEAALEAARAAAQRGTPLSEIVQRDRG